MTRNPTRVGRSPSIVRAGVARVLQCLLVLVCVCTLRAHDPGLSTLSVVRDGPVVTATFGVAPADLAIVADADELEAVRAFAAGAVVVTGRDGRLRPADVDVRREDDVSVHITLRFENVGEGPLRVALAAFDRLPRGHRCLLTQLDGDAVAGEALLSATRPGLDLGAAAAGTRAAGHSAGAWRLAFDFVVLGIEHILIGWDHILFLLSLLLVSRGWRSILGTVSAFTVAHSITLCLASLHVVALPSRLVEAVIALSVVAVALENVARRGRVGRSRWLTTAAFGLVHGFGFASVLAELDPGATSSPVVALASFNVGVELGQLAIAAVASPLLALAVQRSATGRRWVVPAISLAIAAVGAYWLYERTVL